MSDILPILLNRNIPLVAKMILGYLATRPSDDGLGVFTTNDMLSDVTSGSSDSTISHHIGWLIANGYLREGNQDLIKPQWRSLPSPDRPIIYDLALNEETRLAWKAEAP